MTKDDEDVVRAFESLARWWRRGDWLSGDPCPIEVEGGPVRALGLAAALSEAMERECIALPEAVQ